MEAPLLAEGLRKLAALIRLMQNGSIRRGSVLFWDEPEANLNPILSKTVTQTIYALARHEVQVVLATHDYLLASRLSLLAQDNTSLKDPLVRFIGLTAPGDEDGSVLEVSGGTQVGVGDKLEDLPRPLLVEALTQHADFEQRLLLNRLIEA